MATIRDIAELAGVSISTVSQALRNHSRISAPTRARIQAIARQLHYRPPGDNAQMSGECTHVLGCLLQAVGNPLLYRVLSGIHHAAYEHGYKTIVIEQTWFVPYDLSYSLDKLYAHQVDGVVIVGIPHLITRQTLLELQSRNILPIVALCADAEMPVDAVTIHEQQAATTMLDHLTLIGHRCLGYIELTQTYAYSFRRPLTEMAAGRGVTLHLLDAGTPKFDPQLTWNRLLRLRPRPTGLICQNDVHAMHLLHTAPAYGVQVPHDLSVIGCGGVFGSGLTNPALTTVDIQPEVIGRHAVKRLVDRLTGSVPLDAAPERETVPVRLLQRDSCHVPIVTRRTAGTARLTPTTDRSRGDAILATLRDGFANYDLYCTNRALELPEHPEFWGWLSTDEQPAWHTASDALHIGSVDRHWVYLAPSAVLAYLSRHLQGMAGYAPFSLRDVLSALELTGALRVRNIAGHRYRTMMVRHRGTTARMIVLHRDALHGE